MATKVREYVYQPGCKPTDMKNRVMLSSIDIVHRTVSRLDDGRWVVSWSYEDKEL